MSFASFFRRLGAYVLRGVVPGVGLWLSNVIAAGFMTAAASTNARGEADGIGNPVLFAVGALLLLVSAAWWFAVAVRMIIQRAHLGTDFADAIVGQRLVRDATMAPIGSGWFVFGRTLVHTIDSLPCYLGFLWPLWDAKRQTFADKMLSTVVVLQPVSVTPRALLKNAMIPFGPVIKQA